MLNWALTFLVMAFVSAILGFGAVAPESMAWIAKCFFVVFLTLFVVSMLASYPKDDRWQ